MTRIRHWLGQTIDNAIIKARLAPARHGHPIHTWHGSFYVDPQDTCIARQLARYGHYERHVTMALDTTMENLAPHVVALDIGAHWGWHTRVMASYDHKTIAFEPYPLNAPILRANTKDLPVTVVQAAIMAHTGTHPFHTDIGGNSGMAHAGPHGGFAVKTFTLDDWVGQNTPGPIGFIKIDVQGTEFDVINGARHTIAHHRPTIILEAYPATASRITAMLGYHSRQIPFTYKPFTEHHYILTPGRMQL